MANKRGLVIEEVPIPQVLAGGALLQVEAAAVCGSDWGHFVDDEFFERGRVILGHENVGRLVAVDEAARWDVQLGQRVVVEEFVPCGFCMACRDGRFYVCPATDWRREGSLRYGRTPLNQWPGLWGGFAEFLYVHPSTGMHPIPEGLPASAASFATPVANGLRWLRDVAALRPGERVLVIGPGAHGLGCVLAARVSGAGTVMMVGTERDGRRLEDAHRLGADVTAVTGPGRLLAEVIGDALGDGADVVVDLVPSVASVLEEAIEVAAPGGRIIVAGHKHGARSSVDADMVLAKEVSLLGVRGSTRWSMAASVELLDHWADRVAAVDSLFLPLEATERALRTVGRVQEDDGVDASRVIVLPMDGM